MRNGHVALGIAVVLVFWAAPGIAQDVEPVSETIVVTASRTEQPLHEVPAAITVLDAEALADIPADDFGDYLRNVPGLNVSQISARDIQITGRSATGSLSTSELVLLDGRTLYLDFFGFVMWDYVPMDTKEIKQIEVVRGPGSAVWGANAMSGVINLITKKPKEMQGTSITLGGGDFGTAYGNISHAGVSGKWGYKLSGGYYEQEPFNRPTGIIPGTVGPANPLGTPYPPFRNEGTKQPKVNFRFDYDASVDTTWSFSGGFAATDGIMHSGLGPFDIASGASLTYVKADWNKRAARATFFLNQLDGDATNLLSRDTMGRPITFFFASDTYNLDFSNTKVSGMNNIFTYGATARTNEFDLSIAPRGDSRDEMGVFVQDEILLGENVRWLIGARWDDIDPIGSVVSPRTSLLLSPGRNHSFRASYNRAFRAPSMINNFLDTTIIGGVIPFSAFGLPLPDLPFATRAVGNPRVLEEQLDAYEVGYVGTYGKTTFTISAYKNETSDSIDFFQAAAYTAANPPLGFPPFLAFLLDFPPAVGGLAGLIPSEFSYRNIGEIEDQGVEISWNYSPSIEWSWFVNYSYQDEPTTTGIDRETLPNGTTRDAINTPPENRVNVGAAYSGEKFYFNLNANYQDEAFWTDVLDSRFWGPTDSFTTVSLGAGFYLGDNTTFSITAQNIFDEDVLQHVFGDLIEQKLSAQIVFRFE